jgi:hypothetical protein
LVATGDVFGSAVTGRIRRKRVVDSRQAVLGGEVAGDRVEVDERGGLGGL